MITTAIPAWNAMGVLLAIHSESPTGADRSPYTISLADLVLHFDTPPECNAIVRGFPDGPREDDAARGVRAAGVVHGW